MFSSALSASGTESQGKKGRKLSDTSEIEQHVSGGYSCIWLQSDDGVAWQ